jgi:hypothetical protein
LKQNKKRGKLLFVHDSDITFNSLPNFDELIDDHINYVSDCRGYLNYNYLRSCDNRYYERHSDKIYNGQLIREMCDIIGVEPRTIRDQNDNKCVCLLRAALIDPINRIPNLNTSNSYH